MSAQNDTKEISQHDYTWAGIYSELSERYKGVDPLQSAPYLAVRLLVMRVGFDTVLEALKEKGTPWVAAQARMEMTIRQEFMARIVAEYPPEDPEAVDGAVEEMALDLAAIDCPEGGMRMLNYLERLRVRELRFAERSKAVH